MFYVVVRCGVYDQGVINVTTLLSLAKGAAEEAAEKEEDFYHEFEIRTWSKHDQEFSVKRWVLRSEDDRNEDRPPMKWTRVT